MLLQLHPWVTENSLNPLPLEEEHCKAVEVTEEDVQNSVKLIPSLSAVVSKTQMSQSLQLTATFAGASLVDISHKTCLKIQNSCHL